MTDIFDLEPFREMTVGELDELVKTARVAQRAHDVIENLRENGAKITPEGKVLILLAQAGLRSVSKPKRGRPKAQS